MIPLLRISEAARSLGISERSVRRLVARKAIAYHDIPNGGVRFLESDLDAFAKSHRREVVVQAIRSGVYDFAQSKRVARKGAISDRSKDLHRLPVAVN